LIFERVAVGFLAQNKASGQSTVRPKKINNNKKGTLFPSNHPFTLGKSKSILLVKPKEMLQRIHFFSKFSIPTQLWLVSCYSIFFALSLLKSCSASVTLTTSFTKLYGVSSKNFYGYGVVADSSGNLIISGNGNFNFNGASYVGSSDFVVMKITSTGTVTWTQIAGSTNSDFCQDIHIDSNDNVYICGHVTGTIDSNTFVYDNDWAIISYSSSGTKRFTKTLGGSTTDHCYGAVYNPVNSNLYAYGDTASAKMGTFSTGSSSTYSLAGWAKYNINGDTATVSNFTVYPGSNNGLSEFVGAVVDNAGNIIMIGSSALPTFLGKTMIGLRDGIIVQISSTTDGMKWVAREGGSSYDYFYNVCIDTDDNIYVIGSTVSTTISGATTTLTGSSSSSSSYDIILYKYSSTGTRLLAKHIGGYGDDHGYGIAYDNGYLYMTGSTSSLSTNFPEGGSSTGTQTSGCDAYLIVYDTSGNYQASTIFSSSYSIGRAVTVYNSMAYVIGYATSSVNSVSKTGGSDILAIGVEVDIPTIAPTVAPTSSTPTVMPTTALPTALPTTAVPSVHPSLSPSVEPTLVPTSLPTEIPSCVPTEVPTYIPSAMPTKVPSESPSVSPTEIPTRSPSNVPTATPSLEPTFIPTENPTPVPTLSPTTALPTISPTIVPSVTPSLGPSQVPSDVPTTRPTVCPSIAPTQSPTLSPSDVPSDAPTASPTTSPSLNPSQSPTETPTAAPTVVPSQAPTQTPTVLPSAVPTALPTAAPSMAPTYAPTANPTANPTEGPTVAPTLIPSMVPTDLPTISPSIIPSLAPSADPTIAPSIHPSAVPSAAPTTNPTDRPSNLPSEVPTLAPSSSPTELPSYQPTLSPSVAPTPVPSTSPSVAPTDSPTIAPTLYPTASPSTDIPSSIAPNTLLSETPTFSPSVVSSNIPTDSPSSTSVSQATFPTETPSSAPTTLPTEIPSDAPTTISPSVMPSVTPTQESGVASSGADWNPYQLTTGAVVGIVFGAAIVGLCCCCFLWFLLGRRRRRHRSRASSDADEKERAREKENDDDEAINKSIEDDIPPLDLESSDHVNHASDDAAVTTLDLIIENVNDHELAI
jgi:hypothetical protein